MRIEIFNKIKRDFGEYGSFAIWNENIRDTSFISKNINLLHSRVIFVGYNAVTNLNEFQNFHTVRRGGKDIWLKQVLGNHRYFKGAYMTDFFKKDKGRREVDVIVNQTTIQKNADILEKEIKTLDVEKPILVAFGRKAERVLKRLPYEVKFCPHYAGRISFERFKSEIENLGKFFQE